MPLAPPILPLEIDSRLREYLRVLGEHYNEMEGKYRQLLQTINSLPSNIGSGGDSETFGARGLDPILVEALPGQLSQPQIPYAPIVLSLPELGDPQSQNGSLVIFNNTLYQFDGRTSPGDWNPIMGSGGTVTSVAITTPAGLVVAGSPITTTGTFALTSRNSNNITAVTKQANTTADQELMTYSLPASILSLGAQVIRITASGIYSTEAGETPLITIKIKLTSPVPTTITILTIQTFDPTTQSSVDSQWRLISEISVVSAGATGTLLVKGKLSINMTDVPTAGVINYMDINTVASGAINLTVVEVLKITASFSTQPGAVFNAITQEELLVEYIN